MGLDDIPLNTNVLETEEFFSSEYEEIANDFIERAQMRSILHSDGEGEEENS
jgi:hypothetical protein